LSEIDVDEMTTFELNILHRCAKNPPPLKSAKRPSAPAGNREQD
jgi:hypothetical protein